MMVMMVMMMLFSEISRCRILYFIPGRVQWAMSLKGVVEHGNNETLCPELYVLLNARPADDVTRHLDVWLLCLLLSAS